MKNKNLLDNLKQIWQEDNEYRSVDFEMFLDIYEEWKHSKSIILKTYFLYRIKQWKNYLNL